MMRVRILNLTAEFMASPHGLPDQRPAMTKNECAARAGGKTDDNLFLEYNHISALIPSHATLAWLG